MTVRPDAASDANHPVEALRLRGRERGRGFVEDDQLGVAGKGPQDLDLLLAADPQRADGGVGRQIETRLAGQAPVPRDEIPSIDETEPARLRAQEYVLGHGQLRDEGKLLGHESDAVFKGLARRTESHRRSVGGSAALDPGERPRR